MFVCALCNLQCVNLCVCYNDIMYSLFGIGFLFMGELCNFLCSLFYIKHDYFSLNQSYNMKQQSVGALFGW